MTRSPALDHIAMTVPDLDEQIALLTGALGMVVRHRMDGFAVVVDEGSDFKLELSESEDGEVHVRHLGFRADDVDAQHATLVSSGLSTRVAPHRQDLSGMYTSYLTQPGVVEVQLVRYD